MELGDRLDRGRQGPFVRLRAPRGLHQGRLVPAARRRRRRGAEVRGQRAGRQALPRLHAHRPRRPRQDPDRHQGRAGRQGRGRSTSGRPGAAPACMELPEIQKLVEELAKDKKDVLVVALSQDRDPKELAEVRKLVEKTLKEKKIDFGTGSVGLSASTPATRSARRSRSRACRRSSCSTARASSSRPTSATARTSARS